MEIYDKPTFVNFVADMYRAVNGVYVFQQTVNNLGLFSITSNLETSPLGITFDAYVANQQLILTPLIHDIFLIEKNTYRVESAPFKQKGAFLVNPFFKLKLKLTKVILPA